MRREESVRVPQGALTRRADHLRLSASKSQIE
jgi:hypothetical protein